MADIGDSGSLRSLLPITPPKKTGSREKPKVAQDKKKQQQKREAEKCSGDQPDQNEPKQKQNNIDDYA